MAFNSAVDTSIEQIGSGEVTSATAAHNETAYDKFEEGLEQGRFVQVAAGVLSNMDATVTPLNVGVSLRNISGEMGVTSYTNIGEGADSHADVCDFGRVTVDVKTGETPAFGGAVSFENVAGADAGKALATGGEAVPNATFVKEIKPDVWEITLKSYMV